MARVNVDVLGSRELRWTGMGEFNSDDYYIYYCGQESLRRNGVAIIGNKSLKYSTWMQSQKQQNDLCSFPRQTIQYHSNPGVSWLPTFAFQSPIMKRTFWGGVSSQRSCRSSLEPFHFSFFSITGWGIDLDYCDIEWFALEMNRDLSVIFEIAHKYCISDSFIDYESYSISSKGFLPTVVNITVMN